jgi:nucleoside-diphosphate-sugar epimerase
MPDVIDEQTPMNPTTRKGALRVALEQRLQAASSEGLRAIVLRAGDVYGGGALGSWFDRIVTRFIPSQGRMTYPGGLDVMHAWAYLPDYAAAMVRVAAARSRLAPFETFGFAGHGVTGRQFLGPIQRATGRTLNVAGMPWTFLKLMSPIVPTFRELTEMSYLWNVPHRIDGKKLASVIGEVPHTPIDDAMRQALAELGLVTAA